MRAYTWVILHEKVLGTSSDAVGIVGPGGGKGRARADRVIREGEAFRMRSLDGRIKYYGYILGDFDGTEPLRDFGLGNECTAIEYKQNGAWLELI